MSQSDIPYPPHARSAANAQAVGFDAIAIHGAHGYLIDTFMWNETHFRDDSYGGDIARRARFGAEIVSAIRAAIGPDLPIIFRYSQWKQQDFNARIAETPEQLALMLAPLVDSGVDMFDVSTRVFSASAFEGSPLSLAGWTRRLTGIATAAVGGIGLARDLYGSMSAGSSESLNNLDEVLRRFERGEFNIVAVGRSLLAEREWPRTARLGRLFKPFHADILKYLS